MQSIKNVAIVGFGNFGQFFAPYLEKHFNLLIIDKLDKVKMAEARGYHYGPTAAVSECEVIILATPMQDFDTTVMGIAPHVKRGTLVMDVCSLKVMPCNVMKELLSARDCTIIGTHPLFGPQSIRNGNIQEGKVALCPVSSYGGCLANIQQFLSKSLGVQSFVTTPEEHDRQMRSQALTLAIGEVLSGMDFEDVTLRTKTFDNLMTLSSVARGNNPDLLAAIQEYNPYAAEIRQEFIDRMGKLHKRYSNA